MTLTMNSLFGAKPLVANKRGAIMVLGIFMACMMIGWMWMLVGLGDAMIWRDRSQEAADAMAYSSAAVQAKGMNFISFLNAVMMILTAIYLLLAVIFDIVDFFHMFFGSEDDGGWLVLRSSCQGTADTIAVVGAACALVPGLDLLTGPLEELSNVWCPVATGLHKADGFLNTALTDYGKMMADTMPYISDAEDVVAYAAPWAGVVTGSYVAYKHIDQGQHHIGLPLSATMIPASKFPAPVKEWTAEDKTKPFTGRDAREGLPVQISDHGMSDLCKAAAQTVLGPIADFFNGIPILGWIMAKLVDGIADSMQDDFCMPDSSGIFGSWDGAVHDVLGATRIIPKPLPAAWGPDTNHDPYHIKRGNDNFWNNPDKVGGPHVMVGYAANGNDWMQVWGMVYGGNRVEQSEKKVGVAGDKNASQNSEGLLTGGLRLYIGQAEFYFDCEEMWSSDECNGPAGSTPWASYKMNWRTRLRRVHGLSWGADLLNWVWGTSFAGSFDTRATQWVSNTGLFQSFASEIGQWKSKVIMNGVFNDLKQFAGDQVGGMLDPSSAQPNVIH